MRSPHSCTKAPAAPGAELKERVTVATLLLLAAGPIPRLRRRLLRVREEVNVGSTTFQRSASDVGDPAKSCKHIFCRI